MLSFDNSAWFLEFEFNGEAKRIHYFEHLPMDLVLEVGGDGKDVSEVFDALLWHDCQLRLSDFDAASARALIDELSRKGGEGLGE